MLWADEADIHSNVFFHFLRHIAAALADLFPAGKCQQRAVFGLQAVLFQILHHGEHAGNSGLIIDESGLDVAVGRNLTVRSNVDNIAVADTKRLHFLLGRNGLIQQNVHGLIVAGQRAGIEEHMNRVGIADHHTGIAASVTGMNRHGRALDIAEVDAAQCADAQRAVGFNMADHQAEGVSMCTQQNGFAVILTIERNIRCATAIIENAITKHGGIFLQHGKNQHIVAYRAGDFHHFLKTLNDKLLIDLKFHTITSQSQSIFQTPCSSSSLISRSP